VLRTQETLATGNLLSVINVLMQLRKVCNHPNLFEVRPTTSPFQMEGLDLRTASLVYGATDYNVWTVSRILLVQNSGQPFSCQQLSISQLPKIYPINIKGKIHKCGGVSGKLVFLETLAVLPE